MRMHSDQMLEMARETIELVILRLTCEIANNEGSQQYKLNRIRDLNDALDLINPKVIVIDLMEHAHD